MPEAGPDGAPEHVPQVPGLPSAGAGVAQAGAAEFSVAASLGGVRGILEAVVPYAVFSIVYGIDQDLRTSIIAALVPAAVLSVWRLIAREPLTQAISGLIGIAIGAWVATRTGNATTFFLPNILKNLGFALAYAVSALVRWPLLGVLLGPVLGEMFEWRKDRPRLRAYIIATWLWVAMFGVRLAVQVPLFLADRVTLLGSLNAFVLGLPLFGLTVWLSWLVLRRVPVVKPASPHHPAPEPARD